MSILSTLRHSATLPFAAGMIAVGTLSSAVLMAGPSGGSSKASSLPVAGLTESDIADINAVLFQRSSSTGEVLAVGSVDAAGYRSAIDSFVSCVQVETDAPALKNGGRLQVDNGGFSKDRFRIDVSFSISFGREGAAAEHALAASRALDEAEMACHAEHLGSVELAYQAGLLADPRYVLESEAGMHSCLKAAGIEAEGAQEQRLALIENQSNARHEDGVVSCASDYPSISTRLSPLNVAD